MKTESGMLLETICTYKDGLNLKVKDILDEDFINYKKPSMFIGSCKCTWKCCIEGGFDKTVCQNSSLAKQPDINFSDEFIFQRYITNPITKSIVIGGLEPFLQFEEVLSLISYFRSNNCNDDFVIYTGYTEEEIQTEINQLKQFPNIIIKFGRFIPNETKQHYDEVLGIELASHNQYGKRIS